MNLWTINAGYWSLALRAGEIAERNFQSSPLVFEQIRHAIKMEDVTTVQLNTRLLLKLLSVADGAKLATVDLCLFAARLHARQAV